MQLQLDNPPVKRLWKIFKNALLTGIKIHTYKITNNKCFIHHKYNYTAIYMKR